MRIPDRISRFLLREALENADKLGLRRASDVLTVQDLRSPSTLLLARTLSRTLLKTKGLGFAAPQIGVFKQMMVIQRPLFTSDCVLTKRKLAEPLSEVDQSIPFASPSQDSIPVPEYATKMKLLMRRLARSLEPPVVVCNPEIVRSSSTRSIEYEGCLSIPDWLGPVPRPADVEVRFLELALPQEFVLADRFDSVDLSSPRMEPLVVAGSRGSKSDSTTPSNSETKKSFSSEEEFAEYIADRIKITPCQMHLHELAARIYQHERDHLHGKLFIDWLDVDDLGGFEYSPLQEDDATYKKRLSYINRCQASGKTPMPPKKVELYFPVSVEQPIIPCVQSEGLETL